jgi:predicted membrane channel-forming protein YqfA (hemolysin III family)
MGDFKVKKRLIYIILFVLLFISGYLMINYPTIVGVANNSDFARIVQPIGLKTNDNIKHFYMQQKFDYVKNFDSLTEHMKFVFNPGIESIAQYKSTHFAIIKVAQILNGIFKYIKTGSITNFDIRTLSILYIGIFALAMVIFIKSIKVSNVYYKISISMFLLFVFMDKGYLVYFNSLFGEPLMFVSFLLYFSCVLYIINHEKDNYFIYVLSIISGCMFIGAKVANIPLGFLMIIFSIIMLWYKKGVKTRIIVSIGIVCMLITSVYYLASIPEWMSKVNGYHALFYGVLKDSPSPKQDLRDLGIEEKYEVLKNTHSYMDHQGYDMYGEEFEKEVFDKASPVNITMYYLTHFDRLMEKIDKCAKSSTIIRPPYLGNYRIEDDEEVVKLDNRLSYWESIRKSTYDNALLIIIILVFLYIITSYLIIKDIKKQNNRDRLSMTIGYRSMLILCAGSQFIFPVIGNGEADIMKHMFLFNLLFDIMIVMVFMDILYFVQNKQLKVLFGISSLVMVIFIITIFIKGNNSINTIVLGKYNNEEIVWEILEETDNYYFIASKKVIDRRQFEDSNSNIWLESDIRNWLNSDKENGFLYGFSNADKQKVIEMPMKTVLSPVHKNLIQLGYQAHYWYCIPGYIEQNYDVAYGKIDDEKVFLLSVKDYENYNFHKKKKEAYWLRTPYTNPRIIRVVETDGFIYHKEAKDNMGVVPCMYIKK